MTGPGALKPVQISVMSKRKEQRRHKRFKAPQGAFAGLGPDFNKVGQIIDISMGGLAFRYIGKAKPANRSHLDIIMIEPDFYLGNVPCVTVSDFPLDGGISFNATRRSSVRFGKLTPYQKVLLGQFVEGLHAGET
jgi:hypothetical protein